MGLFLQVLASSSRQGLGSSAYPFVKHVISSFSRHQDLKSLPSHVRLCIHLALFKSACEYEEIQVVGGGSTNEIQMVDYRKVYKHIIDLRKYEPDFHEDEGEGLLEPLTRTASSSSANLKEAVRVFQEMGQDLKFEKNGNVGVDVEIMNALIRAANRRKAIDLAEEIYEMRTSLWNWREASKIKPKSSSSSQRSENSDHDSPIPKPTASQSLIPNLSTFHSLLRTCIISSNVQRGKDLLSDLNHYKLKATSKTFELFISLNFSQNSITESIAFFDEMRTQRKLKPTRNTYDMLIRRAAEDHSTSESVSVDWKELVKEMMEDGYLLSGQTLKYLRELGFETREFTEDQR